jgi:hypothetical protein
MKLDMKILPRDCSPCWQMLNSCDKQRDLRFSQRWKFGAWSCSSEALLTSHKTTRRHNPEDHTTSQSRRPRDVTIQKTTWRHNPEDHNSNFHRRQNSNIYPSLNCSEDLTQFPFWHLKKIIKKSKSKLELLLIYIGSRRERNEGKIMEARTEEENKLLLFLKSIHWNVLFIAAQLLSRRLQLEPEPAPCEEAFCLTVVGLHWKSMSLHNPEHVARMFRKQKYGQPSKSKNRPSQKERDYKKSQQPRVSLLEISNLESVCRLGHTSMLHLSHSVPPASIWRTVVPKLIQKSLDAWMDSRINRRKHRQIGRWMDRWINRQIRMNKYMDGP